MKDVICADDDLPLKQVKVVATPNGFASSFTNEAARYGVALPQKSDLVEAGVFWFVLVSVTRVDRS